MTKRIALYLLPMLNFLVYGAIVVYLGIMPVLEDQRHPSDMSVTPLLIVITVGILVVAAVCASAAFNYLRSTLALSKEDSLLWTHVLLLAAPFASVALDYVTFPISRLFYPFTFLIIGFVLPFILMIVLAKYKLRGAESKER